MLEFNTSVLSALLHNFGHQADLQAWLRVNISRGWGGFTREKWGVTLAYGLKASVIILVIVVLMWLSSGIFY
ncbi:hypothetical protein RIF29_30026 [Crotalaria pallida]|uniref:Uncharacterized protein n=1 Tax=Crotalaria pallida TaxID=3830 RepID=A0AAN9EFV2_CROPI